MEEIWKDIVGYEGLYQVSNLGRVRSMERTDSRGHKRGGFIMVAKIKATGYYQIGLTKDGKQRSFSVHRLVAQAFIPNPDNLPCVNHKDECRTNNTWTNLEWCSAQYNYMYGTRIKKCAESNQKPILQMKNGIIIKKWESLKEAEAQGFVHSCVSRCCKGVLAHYKGYQWEYAISQVSE